MPLDLVDADLEQKLEPRPPRPDAPLALIKRVRAASTLRSISLSRFAITVDLAASAWNESHQLSHWQRGWLTYRPWVFHRVDALPTGFVEIGGAMAAVAVLGLLALLSDVRRFDGVLLWALGGTTGAWLVVDHEHEIAVLWTLSESHGLTVADLAAIPSVLIAGALGLCSLRANRTQRRR